MSYTTKEEERSARLETGLCPRLLGAGFCFAAFLGALRFSAESADSVARDSFLFTVSTAVGIAFCAALIGIWAFFFCKKAGRPLAHGAQFLLAGSALCLIGTIALGPLYLPILPFPAYATLGLGFAFGLGATELAVAWGLCFSTLEPEQLLPNGAAVLLLAEALRTIQAAADFQVAGLVLIVAYLVVGGLLAWRSRKAVLSEESRQAAASPNSTKTTGMLLRRAWSLLWMPLVGACLSAFVFGLIWDPLLSSEGVSTAPGAFLTGLAGSLLMALFVFLAERKAKGSSSLRLFNQGIYPLAVALLLIIPVVSLSLPDLRPLSSVLSTASFALVALCAWCNMAGVVRSISLSAYLVFPAGVLLLAASFLIGLFAIGPLGTSGRALCLVLFGVYLALIAVFFAFERRDSKENRTDHISTDNSRSYIHRRCDEIAQQHALSPREAEVLFYLGRGYNHTYIAKKLYISENTVRTHVRHIYNKLEISSREELIDLVDEKDSSL